MDGWCHLDKIRIAMSMQSPVNKTFPSSKLKYYKFEMAKKSDSKLPVSKISDFNISEPTISTFKSTIKGKLDP